MARVRTLHSDGLLGRDEGSMIETREMDAGARSGNREAADRDSCLVSRVVIRNYKSIAACDVQLGPLSFLVGPNGSGKSNFLDAFAFVAESLRHSLETALDRRHGYYGVCRELGTRAEEFGIRLECNTNDFTAQYSFSVRSDREEVRINREICRVVRRGSSTEKHFYIVEDGKVVSSSMEHPPAACPDRLYLVNVSGSQGFGPVFEALCNISVYKVAPDSIRVLGKHEVGSVLGREGANIASVIYNMQKKQPDLKMLMDQYLQKIVPGLKEVKCVRLTEESRTTLLLFSELAPDQTVQSFTASQMSSGTLRALGILTSLFQIPQRNGLSPPFIAIEEPEDGLHIDAIGALLDSLRHASNSAQIVVSSHSTDLLDHKSISEESILAVSKTENGTQIGTMDESGRYAIKDRLFTAGELLRANALRLSFDLNPSEGKSIDLFAGME